MEPKGTDLRFGEVIGHHLLIWEYEGRFQGHSMFVSWRVSSKKFKIGMENLLFPTNDFRLYVHFYT